MLIVFLHNQFCQNTNLIQIKKKIHEYPHLYEILKKDRICDWLMVNIYIGVKKN